MSPTKCKECKKEISGKAKECPNCGNPIKKGMGCGTVIVLLGLLLLVIGYFGTKSNDSGQKLSESSPEYRNMAMEHMKTVTDDPAIDSIRIEGSLLYINFNRPQSKQEYIAVARANAIKFSQFKKSKLGVSGVTVYISLNGNNVAQANARNGQITQSS